MVIPMSESKGKSFLIKMIGGAVFVLLLCIVGALSYRGREAPTLTTVTRDIASVVPVSAEEAKAKPPSRDHFYDFRDGIDYGYTMEQSQTQKEAGQAGSAIVVFNYAGERAGRHQLHSRDGGFLVAFECTNPCEVMKVITVLDADGMRQNVRVERVRPQPNMIAALAVRDAAAGKLDPYVEYPDGDRHGRHVAVWVDERQGLTRTVIKKAESRTKAGVKSE
jgi:hypothetical protein